MDQVGEGLRVLIHSEQVLGGLLPTTPTPLPGSRILISWHALDQLSLRDLSFWQQREDPEEGITAFLKRSAEEAYHCPLGIYRFSWLCVV